MVNSILFLVGKGSDEYPLKYTSRKAPQWLRRGAKTFSEFVNEEDHTVPSDVAMAMFLHDKHPRSRIDCMNGSDAISKKLLDPYDLVVVIYDPIEVFHCGGRDKTCPLPLPSYGTSPETDLRLRGTLPRLPQVHHCQAKLLQGSQEGQHPCSPIYENLPQGGLEGP